MRQVSSRVKNDELRRTSTRPSRSTTDSSSLSFTKTAASFIGCLLSQVLATSTLTSSKIWAPTSRMTSTGGSRLRTVSSRCCASDTSRAAESISTIPFSGCRMCTKTTALVCSCSAVSSWCTSMGRRGRESFVPENPVTGCALRLPRSHPEAESLNGNSFISFGNTMRARK